MNSFSLTDRIASRIALTALRVQTDGGRGLLSPAGGCGGRGCASSSRSLMCCYHTRVTLAPCFHEPVRTGLGSGVAVSRRGGAASYSVRQRKAAFGVALVLLVACLPLLLDAGAALCA